MSENKINKKIVVPYFASFLFLLASYLFYTIVPVSDLANSVEHSGMDAVYLLTCSPVFAFLALLALALALFIDLKYLVKHPMKILLISGFSLLCVFILVSAIFSVIFVSSQYKLGFTAPINDTVYFSYSKFILASVILQTIFAVVSLVLSKVRK